MTSQVEAESQSLNILRLKSVQNWESTHGRQGCDHTERQKVWAKVLAACLTLDPPSAVPSDSPLSTSPPRWYYLVITLLDRCLSLSNNVDIESWDGVLAMTFLVLKCECQKSIGHNRAQRHDEPRPSAPRSVDNAKNSILEVLNDELDWPTPFSFIHRLVGPGPAKKPILCMVETIMFVASLAGYVTKFAAHTMAAASCVLARCLLMEDPACVDSDMLARLSADALQSSVQELKILLRKGVEQSSQWPKIPKLWRYRAQRLALLLALSWACNGTRCWHKRQIANRRCQCRLGKAREVARARQLEALRLAGDGLLDAVLRSTTRFLLCRCHHHDEAPALLNRLIRSPGALFIVPPLKFLKATETKHPRELSTHAIASSEMYDDSNGNLIANDGDQIGQYQIKTSIGRGAFGEVVRAYDMVANEHVALKILRSGYQMVAKEELSIMKSLQTEKNRGSCIRLQGIAVYNDHYCIAMELLGTSLYDFLKANSFVPFPNSHIKLIARQLLESVAFVHSLEIIHADLKLENILLRNDSYQVYTYNRMLPRIYKGDGPPDFRYWVKNRNVLRQPNICLIDFGLAVRASQRHNEIVGTLHYRAPEMILRTGWSYPCDIWGIACILVELYTGQVLFSPEDNPRTENEEHLAMMREVLGHLPDNKDQDYSMWLERPKTSTGSTETLMRLEELIPESNDYLKGLLGLLCQMFVFDPSKRITAAEALTHEWFQADTPRDDGTEAAKLYSQKR